MQSNKCFVAIHRHDRIACVLLQLKLYMVLCKYTNCIVYVHMSVVMTNLVAMGKTCCRALFIYICMHASMPCVSIMVPSS